MKVVPIDIDFAGWTEVEAGQHNAWGVIDDEGGLRAWASTQIGAQTLAEANNEKDQGTNA